VVLLPSDHHVCDEAVLTRALRTAVAELETRRDAVIILGITPEALDPDLGYIVPGAQTHGMATLERFVEKPSATLARSLVAAGALWNAFIIAAHTQTLLRLFRMRIPQIVAEMSAAVERDAPSSEGVALQALYERLETIDFSERDARCRADAPRAQGRAVRVERSRNPRARRRDTAPRTVASAAEGSSDHTVEWRVESGRTTGSLGRERIERPLDSLV
jgi:hypothetical protein